MYSLYKYTVILLVCKTAAFYVANSFVRGARPTLPKNLKSKFCELLQLYCAAIPLRGNNDDETTLINQDLFSNRLGAPAPHTSQKYHFLDGLSPQAINIPMNVFGDKAAELSLAQLLSKKNLTETKIKVSKNKGRTPWNIGKAQSEETKRRISAAVNQRNFEKLTLEAQALGLTAEQLIAQRMEEKRERRARQRKGITDEARKKMSEYRKQCWRDPAYRERYHKVRSGRSPTLETRARISAGLRRLFASPEYKLANPNRKPLSAEWRSNISKGMKERYKDPDYHRYMVQALVQTPESKRKKSEKTKALWRDPHYVARVLAGKFSDNIITGKHQRSPEKKARRVELRAAKRAERERLKCEAQLLLDQQREEEREQLKQQEVVLQAASKVAAKFKQQQERMARKLQKASSTSTRSVGRPRSNKPLKKAVPKHPGGFYNAPTGKNSAETDRQLRDVAFDSYAVLGLPRPQPASPPPAVEEMIEEYDDSGHLVARYTLAEYELLLEELQRSGEDIVLEESEDLLAYEPDELSDIGLDTNLDSVLESDHEVDDLELEEPFDEHEGEEEYLTSGYEGDDAVAEDDFEESSPRRKGYDHEDV